MAIGSGEEAKLWCRYAQDLGYVEVEHAERWRDEFGHIVRMLQGLRSTLERDPSGH
jgi:four helix bundle protein